MNSRFAINLTIASALLASLTTSLLAETSAESKRSKKKPARSKTQYTRYVPGPDPAAATRAFDAQWKAIFFYTPVPTYPYEPRRSRITGSGVLRIYVDESGMVTTVKILKSTGNEALDTEGLRTFARWRAKSGPPREVDMPLTFVLGGAKGPTSPQRNDGLGIMRNRDR